MATRYYIATTGDDANDGSINSPWRHFAYACDHATVAGDIITVDAADFVETSNGNVRVGVSVEGFGESSHIINEVSVTRNGDISGAALNLSSPSQGTAGNQHIDGLKIDGNYYEGSTGGSSASGNAGILVKRRSGVLIQHTTVQGFYLCGIALHGGDAYQQPSTYATGNEIYDCIITDNGNEDNTWGGGGNIEIGSQSGPLIHDNTITATGRPDYGLINGNNLSGVHYNKGLKFYNNILTKREQESVWSFHIEMWNTDGGFEIYNNEFYGGDTCIDIAGDWSSKGAYDYSWYVHNNLFSNSFLESGQRKIGIDIENGIQEDIVVKYNHFYHIESPINVTDGTDPNVRINRVTIEYNIFEECGSNIALDYRDAIKFTIPADMIVTDFNFNNNVFLAGASSRVTGWKIENDGQINNLNVKNNIIINMLNDGGGGWIVVNNSGDMDEVHFDYNVLYNNNNNNDPVLNGNDITNYSFIGNIKQNPLFVSSTDFHLQEGSPAIGAGTDLGLSFDYEGAIVANPPSIGAFEYNAVIPVTAVTVSGAGGAIIINVNDGTLQMSAHIDPHDATDQTVVWSVIPETGSASIDQDGLLTAITNGTVQVKATSNG